MASVGGHRPSMRGLVLAVGIVCLAVIGNVVLLASLPGSSHAGGTVRSSSTTTTGPTSTTAVPTTTTASSGSTLDLTGSAGGYSGSAGGQQSLPFTANAPTPAVVPIANPVSSTPEVPNVLLLALVASALTAGAVLLRRRRDPRAET